MKKLLALLMVLLLLPASALAEAMCFEVTVTADETNLLEQLKASGIYAGANEDVLCAALAKLINGSGLRVITQEGGGSVELLVAGETLLDAAAMTTATELLFTSGLMGDYALTIPMEVVELLGDAADVICQKDALMPLLDGALKAAEAQLEGVNVTTARGSFSGHAYYGGVYCDTYTFDDAQLAAILDAFATDDLREQILGIAELLGMDTAVPFAQFDAKNAQVTAENAYRYVVRMVYDAEKEPIGLSAVALQGDSQLVTLSIGMAADALNIVIGIGMDEMNYWHSHEITIAVATDENGVETRTYSGMIAEFTAPKEDDFAYAQAASGLDQLRAVWSLDLTRKGAETTWKFSHQERKGTSTAISMVDWNGSFTAEQHLQSTLTTRYNGKPCLTVSMSWEPCEDVSVDLTGLALCSLLTDDTTQFDELAYNAGTELAIRVLKIIPAQLLN